MILALMRHQYWNQFTSHISRNPATKEGSAYPSITSLQLRRLAAMAVQSDDVSYIRSDLKTSLIWQLIQRVSRIHDLELTRQRRLHQTELIKRDEDARRLKLRAITLKDDNVTLKEHLTQKDSYQRQWIKQRDQLRTELNEAREMIRSHETRSRKQTLDVTALKVC
jgi:hypothetical protein